ncbi:tetratricopeptide repeat protein [Winogradskyella sp. DF17]|uniref:Tetratricopeptide repeat protein n=2 Tax=Winogradskyella pelagia TaxID=2819984 RepID=A0ABS3SZR5_9FLAO|nr:tetratricopeptide repeat protein [Winogradskyella sp. DF17]
MCFSQKNTIDSIQKALTQSSDKKERVVLLSELSEMYKEIDTDSALVYAKKGIRLAKEIDFSFGEAENASSIGGIFIVKNNLDSSQVYYHKAKTLYKSTKNHFKYAQTTMRLGNINLAQNIPISALKLYQESLEIAKAKNFNALLPHLFNNTGLVFQQIEDYDDAVTNFEKAYDIFLANNDEANSVYPLYNIALIKSILGKDDEAIDGYLNLVSYHLKTENWVSLAQIYNSISEIYFNNEEYTKATEYLEMALTSVKDKSDSFNTGPTSFYKATIYTNAAEIYHQENNEELAKSFAHKAIKLSLQNSYKLNMMKSARILADIYDKSYRLDSALYYHKKYIDFSNQYQEEYDVKQLTKLKMQNQFDEILRQNEIDRIYKEASYKNREIKFIAGTVAVGLLAIILILLFINQKNKTAKLELKEQNLQLEKKELNQRLEYKKKELASNMMYLMEKNEFITSISKKLIELKPDAKKDNKDLIQQIINEIRQNSSTKMWEEFEVRFKEVHKDFYNALHAAHPNLTLNEVKICAFLRLNMTTKEISAITHQSVKSINMARFRLRKKLNIERDDNLVGYLNSL